MQNNRIPGLKGEKNMQLSILIFEMIGTIAFSLSGAITAFKKNMDLLGICVLGLTTAVGGGMIRDLILGALPPAVFDNPQTVIISICTSLVVFIPVVRTALLSSQKFFDWMLILTDAIGLAIFTVNGARIALNTLYGNNFFLVVFVAVVTGVGGGVMRDIFAGDRPYIFVKHIYALASLSGALLCSILWNTCSHNFCMVSGFVLIVILRILSAVFRWQLPKAGMPPDHVI